MTSSGLLPKVWSFNPEITNPHWIYPGDQVRLRVGGAPRPVEGDPVAAGLDAGRARPSAEGFDRCAPPVGSGARHTCRSAPSSKYAKRAERALQNSGHEIRSGDRVPTAVSGLFR